MEKEFSLIIFLEKLKHLEEKFNKFLLDTKNICTKKISDLNIIKDNLINEIVLELLPLNDSMEMFSKSFKINQNGEMEILVLIFKLINKFFIKFEVKQISKIGINFNPEIHEAIGMYPTLIDSKKNTIKHILQVGYMRKFKLLRPALVIVYN
ncbi:nucleotide exchange factor GrpE [Candidatus Carsonella ruddii]|uniref:Chaperone protein GrpE n=1 Tax=Candidatus Carsonella ruddii PC isolate NHV TaxID=1202540 RepID=J3YQP1_CARRU|nr:nucleotide exchange factor GrpE [Candidatus Carsonella ruddii]AFP84288.1 chaperone protein GrpE [Candidatus Carsonella ruddii PC isolate NHV]